MTSEASGSGGRIGAASGHGVAQKSSSPAEGQDPIPIVLEITGSGANYILRWTAPYPGPGAARKTWPKYAIDRVLLEAQTRKVREALERFATCCVDRLSSEQVGALELLVAEGRELYEILLTPNDPEDGADFRQWLESVVLRVDEPSGDPSFALEMVLNSTSRDFMPPLGLAFTPRRGRVPAQSLNFENYTDFWCISLRCACFTDIQLKNPMSSPISGDKFDTVIVREQSDRSYLLVEKIIKQHKKSFSIEDKQRLAGLSLRTKLAEAYAGKGVLFHFDLEATTTSGEELRYPYDEDSRKMLSPQDFQRIMKEAKVVSQGKHFEELSREKSPAYAIAVIDREAIIRGDRGTGWLDIFFNTPWIGLIAVEGDVKSNRAWDEDITVRPDRFLGLAFLRSILERKGRRLRDSIVEARRECWPFSLFFGVYCNPQQPWITDQPALVEDISDIIPILGEHHPAFEVEERRIAVSS